MLKLSVSYQRSHSHSICIVALADSSASTKLFFHPRLRPWSSVCCLVNYTIYDIVTIYDPTIYPAFTAWVGIWAAIFHWIVAFGNFSDYMAYVTDFSSETFGMYVGIIYCSK
jgi:hypothetical protein